MADEVTLTVRLLALTSRRSETRTGEIAVETRLTFGGSSITEEHVAQLAELQHEGELRLRVLALQAPLITSAPGRGRGRKKTQGDLPIS